MLQRIISSLVGLPLLILVLFWPGGLPFAAGVVALSLISLTEFFGACIGRGFRPQPWLGAGAAVLFLIGAYMGGTARGSLWPEAALTLLLLGGLIAELGRKERAAIRDLGATLLGTLYGGWLFRYLILLRRYGPALLAPLGARLSVPLPAPLTDQGAWLVLLVVLATWACDTGAFFTGRALGKRKLAPAISPGKTVEGAAGGLVAAVAMALAIGTLLQLPFAFAIALGILVGLLAPVGDLCGSTLKRELGIKDFGGLLPGHGGVLDRFDSLLMTAPVVYYLLLIIHGR